MNISIAVLLISMVGGADPIPTKPGTTWFTENMEKGKPYRVKWEVIDLPADFTGSLVEEKDEKVGSIMPKWTPVTGDTPGLTGIKVDGNLRYLVKTLSGEQRIYMDHFAGQNLGGGRPVDFLIELVIPRQLHDGASWTTSRGVWSCGVGIFWPKAKATGKTWGSKSGFRIEVQDTWRKNTWTIDIVPGKEILGIGRVN